MGRLLWLAAALGAAGCGSATGPAQPDAEKDTLESVAITGMNKVTWTLSTQLKAVATFSSGRTLDVSTGTTWTSDTASVATVDGGTVTGVDGGMTTIHATYEGHEGTLPLTVAMPLLAVSNYGNNGINFFPANAT